ncbi:MAG: transcriptional regulator [Deltaproteobacteria bacterium]|jgi:transcriptional regulator with XRE-family HTH domain|nr:transcriptional regulator [Deltaproteobacteria bacterium]
MKLELFYARTEKVLTQAELARLAGVSASTISVVELGGLCGSATLWDRLEAVLGKPQGELRRLRTSGNDAWTGDALRRRRRALGMTQDRLGKLAGVTKATISGMERGVFRGKLDTRKRLEAVLDGSRLDPGREAAR